MLFRSLSIGAATRLSEYVMSSTKTYVATICLGIETDTYDAEGKVRQTSDTSHPRHEPLTTPRPAECWWCGADGTVAPEGRSLEPLVAQRASGSWTGATPPGKVSAPISGRRGT